MRRPIAGFYDKSAASPMVSRTPSPRSAHSCRPIPTALRSSTGKTPDGETMYAQEEQPSETPKCACEKRKTGFTPIKDLCKQCLIDFVRYEPADRC